MELGLRILSFGFAPALYKLETRYEMQTPPGVQKDTGKWLTGGNMLATKSKCGRGEIR